MEKLQNLSKGEATSLLETAFQFYVSSGNDSISNKNYVSLSRVSQKVDNFPETSELLEPLVDEIYEILEKVEKEESEYNSDETRNLPGGNGSGNQD